jgi:divalent metal cation (Fe/Co/Zn/Cd) transporter
MGDPAVGLLITIAILTVLRDAARQVYRRLMDAVDPAAIDAGEAALAQVAGCARSAASRCAGSGTRCAPRPTSSWTRT